MSIRDDISPPSGPTGVGGSSEPGGADRAGGPGAPGAAMDAGQDFAGRIAVVSGGASGIGLAVVRGLLARGARVAVLDIADVELAALRALAGAGANANTGADADRLRLERVDIARSDDVESAVARIEETWGGIALGVSAAGILAVGRVAEIDDATWMGVLQVNTGGVFHLFRALAARMTPRRSGSLVAISSNAAGVPRHGMAAYAASKAAATMFTKCLGLEIATHGVRCNVVSPGSTRTPMQEAMWQAGTGPDAVIRGSLELFRAGIPLAKIAEPGEVAEAVLFLLSDRASHITMADLYVDGGATLRA